MELYTIGHSNHPIERFIGLLQQHAVAVLADVRSVPQSRFAPQFRQAALKASLNAAGIRYAWLGDGLGGKPRDRTLWRKGVPDFGRIAAGPAFADGMARLRTLMAERRAAIMCAERDPEDCHRARLVAPALARDGVKILHILPDGRLLPHAEMALVL